ncbi:uncharacterized protein LOC119360198 [Triticum dicoccoides]|uniref:uncharacterized protein LOC119360198 n=1 Tax=Triticum dicoccoides TaxID=85692 RepID=UPI00188F1821|nr:uncharacterized protein LOC119360198 [Triticum dicoccoides]
MAGGPLDLWNDWSIQILVLLSLTLQVILFLFAGIRRREANPLLNLLLWLTYQLADSTAMFALGHLSLSDAPGDHQLAAFWVPFLMLHLGGPDNITAYALQDNQLWLRHLQMLVVQVLGATYVLYRQITINGPFVLLAIILMFTLGAVKYAERTWALRCGNIDRLRSSLEKEPRSNHYQFHARTPDQEFRKGAADKEELYVRHAHSLFLICKHAMVDSWIEKDPDNHDANKLMALKQEGYEVMWAMMELELSLMYDILYTKAAVVHTWHGYCIRLASPLVTAVSFLLFHFSGKDGNHSSLDVVVTYTLLCGAFLLETISVLAALGSTWTYAFLCATQWNWLQCAALFTGRWDRLRRFVNTMTTRHGGARARRWSAKMGQYNILHRCARRDTAWSPLLGRLANTVGEELKEWWDRKHYSGSIEIYDDLRQRMFDYIRQLKGAVNSQGVLRKSWGQETLENLGLYDYFQNQLGVELQEGIIIWHIGTDIFLAKSSGAKAVGAKMQVKAIRALSNYMMFLLVERPYMLPGLAQARLYERTCKNLVDIWNKKKRERRARSNRLKELFRLRDDPNSSQPTQSDVFAIILYDVEKPDYSMAVPRLQYANRLAKKLLGKEEERNIDVLKLVCDVWMDFLVYAANRCSRESHAKKLSSGGELTTILWLMTGYLHNHLLMNRSDQVDG